MEFLLFEWGVGLAEVDVTLFFPSGRKVTYISHFGGPLCACAPVHEVPKWYNIHGSQ